MNWIKSCAMAEAGSATLSVDVELWIAPIVDMPAFVVS